MSLRSLVQMTTEERETRRENDEAAWHAVHSFIADGEKRPRAFDEAARVLKAKRLEVIAAYWRHDRRSR